MTLTVWLKIQIATHIFTHSSFIMNKKIRISVLVQQQLIIIEQAKFHTCKSIFIDFVLHKWKLTKISFTKSHENITYKGSNKATAQHHKAICNRYYICYNTDMFSQSLESQTDFIMFKHGSLWKCSATYAHTLHLQWSTLTLMKTEQTVSITLETQVSLTAQTFVFCSFCFSLKTGMKQLFCPSTA